MTERQTPELTAGERLLVPATGGGEGLRGLPISFALHAALILIVGWTAVAPLFPALDESAGIIVVEIAKEPLRPDPAILPHPPQAAREASAEKSSVAKASEPPAEPPSQPPAAPSVPPAEFPLAPITPPDMPPSAPPAGMAPAPQPIVSAEETAEIRTAPPERVLPEVAERAPPVEPPPATIEKTLPDVGSPPVDGESAKAEAVLAPEGSQTEPPDPTVALGNVPLATTADSAPPMPADPSPPDAGAPNQTIANAEATSGGPISPASPEMPAAAAIVAEAPNAEAPPAKTDAADAMAAQPATEQPAPQGPAETDPAAAAALPPDAVDAEAAPPPVEQLASQGPAETAPPAVVALPPTAAAMPPAAVEAMAAPPLAELPPPQGPAETEPPPPAAIPPAPVEPMAAPTTAEQPVPQSAAESAPSEAAALPPIADLPSTDQTAASPPQSVQVAPTPAVPQAVEPPPPVALQAEVVQSTPDLPAKANTETDPRPPVVASAPPQDLPSSRAEILSKPSEPVVIVEAPRPDGADPELKSRERQQMASIPVPLSASPSPPPTEQGAPPSLIEMPAKPVSPILPVEPRTDTPGSEAPARESKTEQQVAVLVPPAGKPPRPVPAEAINATLAALPCARVRAAAASGAGGLILSGHVRSRADADGLAAKLSSIMDGQKVDRSALRILGEPYCQVMGFLDRPEFVRSTDQSHNEETLTAGATVGTVRTFFGGQELQLDLVTPDFASEIIVDYFAADGTVVHLFPAKPGEGRFAPAKRVQIGGKDGVGRRVTIAPPYGMDIIVAIASSDRLFDPRRPVQESASGYLDALAETLARSAKASRKIEYTYYVVLTEPRPVARQ